MKHSSSEMINYNEYPQILFTSFFKNDAPPELPFEVASEQVKEYLTNCKGYQELFGYIAVKNSLSGENSNNYYYLNDDLFRKVDSDEFFRNQQFSNFFTSYIKSKHGVILFPNGGQYVFMLLGHKETEKLKKKEGRYIATELFKENIFIGFEEGYILETGIDIGKTGHYESDMPIGGYISFLLVALSHAGDGEHPILETTVKERIQVL